MSTTEHPPCPVCANPDTARHCPAVNCLWWRCDLKHCATVYDGHGHHIRNAIAL